jgi:hypothetical protein
MGSVSEADVRTPRIAVWGFGFSLAGFVLGIVSVETFFSLGTSSNVAILLLALPWGLLSIPGLVLSLLGRRVARRRCVPQSWVFYGVLFGVLGTVILVLYIASLIFLFVSPSPWA